MRTEDVARTKYSFWRFSSRELLFAIVACAAIVAIFVHLFSGPSEGSEQPQLSEFAREFDVNGAFIAAMQDCGMRATLTNDDGEGRIADSRNHDRRYLAFYHVRMGTLSREVLTALRARMVTDLERRGCQLISTDMNDSMLDDLHFAIAYSTSTTQGFVFARAFTTEGHQVVLEAGIHEYPLAASRDAY